MHPGEPRTAAGPPAGKARPRRCENRVVAPGGKQQQGMLVKATDTGAAGAGCQPASDTPSRASPPPRRAAGLRSPRPPPGPRRLRAAAGAGRRRCEAGEGVLGCAGLLGPGPSAGPLARRAVPASRRLIFPLSAGCACEPSA